MDAGGPRPNRGRTARLPLVGAVALALIVLISGLALSSGSAAASTPSASAAPGAGVTPFSERAGYQPDESAAAVGVQPDASTTEVVLTLQSPNPQFYSAVDPTGPAMTASQIGAEYGLSPSAYAQLEEYFESQGLSVVHAWPDRLSLSLSGPALDVGRAFGTTLLSGQYDGRAVTFPETAPALPSSFESEVAAVSGLSEGFTGFSLPSLGTLSSPVA